MTKRNHLGDSEQSLRDLSALFSEESAVDRINKRFILDYSGVKLDMGPHGMCFNGSRGVAQRKIVSEVSPTPSLEGSTSRPHIKFLIWGQRDEWMRCHSK